MKKRILSLSMLVLLTTGCNKVNGIDKDEIKGTAAVVVKEYWKHEKKTYVITGYEFLNADTGTVMVKGYIKGDKSNKIYTHVEYMNNYEINSYASDREVKE